MEQWRQELPIPVYGPHPEYVKFFDTAWEIAHGNVKNMPGMPQTPVMKEGYLDFYIWIWDTCFMSLFNKYAQNSFPGYQSLQNFYAVLHDGVTLPSITVTSKPFSWLTQEIGDVVPILISLVDNPPLFAWAEWNNYLFHGNKAHLWKLLIEKQYLPKHFAFLNSLTIPGQHIPGVDQPTAWSRTDFGYHWGGLASGMDNSPRGRLGKHVVGKNPANPDMLWADAAAQQALSALIISRMAKEINEDALAEHWQVEYEKLKTLLNQYYYDEEDGFYYDISAKDHHFYKVMTTASFWAMLAEVPTPERAARMAEKLTDPELLGGFVPCISLARSDADFNAVHGHYWRGSLWLPTAYMTIKALEKYCLFDLARKLSAKILEHQYRTWKEVSPHTIWECYAPNSYAPAQTGDADSPEVRKNFCGWSALGPIALFIENIIGIYKVDPATRTVYWHLPEKCDGQVGVRNFHFGDVTADLIYEKGNVNVHSEHPVKVVIQS